MLNFDELWGKSTPNSWARVPRGPLAVSVGAFLFGSTGFMATTAIAGVSLATMTGFLITTAVTSWAMAALAPKPDMGSSRGQLTNGREAAGAFDIVYGSVRKGGVVTFMESTDRIGYKVFKNDYLHSVIVLAGHEVEEIGDIYLNDKKVTLDSNGFVTGDRWKSLIRIKKHTGSPTQVADPDLLAETSVTSAFRGRGIAYLYVRMDWDKDVFAGGTPTITAQVKGRKVYDPRTGNTAWSDNAALCIRDYIEQPFGVNSKQSPSSMLSPSWNIGANVSDTTVALKGGGTEKRYTINGIVSTANSPRNNIQKLLTACGGTLFWGQGQWQFKAGYLPASPYLSLDAGDLRSGISLVTRNSRKENFNAVTGIFVDKNQRYTEVQYPKFSSTVFLARDNGQENVLDVTLPYTVTASAAQRLAKMAMFRNREEIIISADFSLKTVDVKVGDVVQFSFDRYGFVNKLFEVITWKPVNDGGELKVNLVLKETSAAAYDWNAEEKDIIGNDSVLPNPMDGLTVSNLVVTNNQVVQSDGTLIGQVTLSWNEAESAFVDHYDVQWKKNSESSWSATTTVEGSIVVPSVVSGILYNYRVRAVTLAGFTGPWEATSVNVPGKNTPPGMPTGLTAQGSYRSVNLKWINPTDKDLNHVRIWKGPTSDVANAILLGRSGGNVFIDGPITPNIQAYYFVQAVDNSGNVSARTAGVPGTALFVGNDDIQDIDVKELLEDAGLASVEILPSLPTTDNFVGRTVYNTADNIVYTWDGSEWKTATVDMDDVQLTINNFPSNLRPVEIVTSLPTSGNYKGRVVFLTTDNKLYRHTGSPTNASGFTSLTPASDISGQITNTQIGPDSIDTAQLRTNAVKSDQIFANSVVFGKVAAGAIGVDQLQANSIVASKLMISDLSNLVINNWTGGDFDGWATSAVGSDLQVQNRTDGALVNAGIQGNVVRIAGTDPWIRSNRSTCSAGESYYAELYVHRFAAAPPGNPTLFQVRYTMQDGSASYTTVGATSQNGGSMVKLSGIVTVPDGAVDISLWIRFNAGAGADGIAMLARPVLRRANSGELIVDGAVKANHMSANSVTAGIISAGAINTAALFVDNVITAAKLDSDSLSVAGLAIFGGTLQSNTWNTNNPGWQLTNSGVFNIRSGPPGGERLLIQNNAISVYDSNGTLRVRLGQL